MKRKVVYLSKGDLYDLTGDFRFSPKILCKHKNMYNRKRRCYEKRLLENEKKLMEVNHG
jgi:hypothetical protein